MARRNHRLRCLVFVWVISAGARAGLGTTYYVATCGNNAWTGTSSVCASPNGPKKTIQAGLCRATQAGDTVVVAQGTYTGAGNRDLVFPKSGGGACPSSTGTARAITLRCETGEDPELCVIDSQGGDVNGNCDLSTPDSQQHRAFRFYQDSASNDSVIEGFTIKNGCMYNRTGEPGSKNYGGGIFIYKSQPTIRHCVFTGNRARRGGAIALESVDPWDPGWLPVIENCTISNNRAVGGGSGGGIWAEGHIDPLIKDCVVTDNCTTSNGLGVVKK